MSILKIGVQGARSGRTYEVGKLCQGYVISQIWHCQEAESVESKEDVYLILVNIPNYPYNGGEVQAANLTKQAESGTWSYIEYNLSEYDKYTEENKNVKSRFIVNGIEAQRIVHILDFILARKKNFQLGPAFIKFYKELRAFCQTHVETVGLCDTNHTMEIDVFKNEHIMLKDIYYYHTGAGNPPDKEIQMRIVDTFDYVKEYEGKIPNVFIIEPGDFNTKVTEHSVDPEPPVVEITGDLKIEGDGEIKVRRSFTGNSDQKESKE